MLHNGTITRRNFSLHKPEKVGKFWLDRPLSYPHFPQGFPQKKGQNPLRFRVSEGLKAIFVEKGKFLLKLLLVYRTTDILHINTVFVLRTLVLAGWAFPAVPGWPPPAYAGLRPYPSAGATFGSPGPQKDSTG